MERVYGRLEVRLQLDRCMLGGLIERTQNKRRRMPWSFRDHLVFSIGFALTRSRGLLRRLLKEHAPDDAKQALAERVVGHLEESGFELDEEARALRQRPPLEPHGMARGE
jgi:hypothetical protein